MIAVVIPYYQRASGLLARALMSVDVQRLQDLRIYVVDDASPSPAEADLALLPSGFQHEVRVLKQANAGPGPARNLALDALDDDIDVVAFLDSDDAWGVDHLAKAEIGFSAGADFYFSDHQREGETETRFAQCGFQPDGPPISVADGVHWCNPSQVFRAIVERSPVGTSTVVIRRGAIGANRFTDQLRSAGEDSIFWLEILSSLPATACGVLNEVTYGRGVNIFSHGGWGDAKSLRTTLDEMRSQHILRTRFSLPPDLHAQSQAQSRRLDLSFCGNLLACTRRLRWDAIPAVIDYLGQRPAALLRFPEAVARAFKSRPPER
jgi:succinoglycan biosynthesis protein ExoW